MKRHIVIHTNKPPCRCFAGYDGEHMATTLLFCLPKEFLSTQYTYLLTFETQANQRYFANISQPPVEYTLPQGLMQKGILCVQLSVVQKAALIYKTSKTELVIRESLSPASEEVDSFTGLLEDTIANLNDCAKVLNNLPKISENNEWLIYDTSEQAYINTNISCIGPKGDSYILTDYDKLQISNLATENLQDSIQTLQSDSAKLSSSIEDTNGYIGYTGNDILGLEADFENKVFTRLGSAKSLNPGADFDKFAMYGGRKRCIVKPNGTILSYYGDEGYSENGEFGSAMVYQPAFYYKVVPLKLDAATEGNGWNIRKARYYISSTPKAGFKLHPAFYDAEQKPVDHIFYSAYEGCIYNHYKWGYEENDDQLNIPLIQNSLGIGSLANVKPASGTAQILTRRMAEKLAKFDGANWHIENIKTISAQQLLMIIEFGQFNVQNAISQGVVDIQKGTAANFAVRTGSTSYLGNTTGRASSSTDGESTYTNTWTTSVSYRGVENPWGNMAQLVQGINIWGDGTMKGGAPYICSDFNYNDSINKDNYQQANMLLSNSGGYISAFGYDKIFDWLFIPTETSGTSSLPVGDYSQCAGNLNGYAMPYYGGDWTNSLLCGAFNLNFSRNPSSNAANLGVRLVYIPTADSRSSDYSTDFSDYVQKKDYVKSDSAGICSVMGADYGITVNGSKGELVTSAATTAHIDSRANKYVPITPANLDYAVRSVLPNSATQLPVNNTLVPQTEYYLGKQTNLSFAFPTCGTLGQYCSVTFISGSTAASLTIDTSNTTDISHFACPKNKTITIIGKWSGSLWILEIKIDGKTWTDDEFKYISTLTVNDETTSQIEFNADTLGESFSADEVLILYNYPTKMLGTSNVGSMRVNSTGISTNSFSLGSTTTQGKGIIKIKRHTTFTDVDISFGNDVQTFSKRMGAAISDPISTISYWYRYSDCYFPQGTYFEFYIR